MISVSGLERIAPKITMALSLGSIIGLFALMTLPAQYSLERLIITPVIKQVQSQDGLFFFSDWPTEENVAKGNVTNISQFQFSDANLKVYRKIYELQNEGQWKKANGVAQKLTDSVLVADVLAERFLAKSYDSDFSELYQWLGRYGDHPDAPRIRSLALRKAPSNIDVPKVQSARAMHTGYGVRDGMGGISMPSGWRHALSAWESRDYNTAQQRFSAIAKRTSLSKWQASAAHFWAYRASVYSGYNGLASYHLREAAMYPFTLYGALAATQLTPNLYRPRFTKVNGELSSQPAIRRAAAFVALGESDKAERELTYLYSRLSDAQRPQLVTLAAAFDLPGLQLRLSQMQHKDPQQSDVTAYPTPGWVPRYDMQVDPALVYAIIRQESAFNVRAKSPAGARGAMQLMPTTANYVIRTQKLNEVKMASLDMSAYHAPISYSDLYKPDVNMMIGQHYIQYLSGKPYIDGNLVYLLAAYNAGPANLLDWQKRYSSINDPLLFMEKIPFKETRHYVKQVMANYLVYQAMMYGQAHSVPALHAGNWPKLPSREVFASAGNREYASR